MSAGVFARIALAAAIVAACRFGHAGAAAAHAPEDASAAASDPATAEQANTSDHVAPPAPQQPMSAMDSRKMIDAMEMDDSATFAMLKLDRFERVVSAANVDAAWKLSAWLGGDFDKLALRSEGERTHDGVDDADIEVLWSHATAAFWNAEIGVRSDFGRGADRSWAAFGVQGRAPYGFDIGATAYAGDAGRAAVRVELEYALQFTQRLILQPRFELNAYSRSDARARTGAGVSDAALGLRLRYEIRREFAPYVGIERSARFGRSADFAQADGDGARGTQWVAGVRIWY